MRRISKEEIKRQKKVRKQIRKSKYDAFLFFEMPIREEEEIPTAEIRW